MQGLPLQTITIATNGQLTSATDAKSYHHPAMYHSTFDM
jgi:hypothetical protein